MDQMMDKDMDQVLQGEGQESAAQETMESMMEQYDISGLRKGDVRTGTVIAETENGWLVDVGYKCEGYLPGKEWTHRILVGDAEKPQKGDDIEVQVINLREGEEAQLLLSRWRHEFDRRWAEFEDLLAQNEILQVKGLRKVKGGLMVDCNGLEGFIPISHLSADGRGVNLGNFVEQVFDVKLLEKDRRKHRIVFSRKSLVEKEAAELRAKFYEEVHEGDVIEGEVSSLTDFGIFVNVGAVDGLVHMSEITWKRNVRIRDTFKKGDKVTVKVIGIDKENDRISLSIKQVEGNPWLTVGERIHKDDVMTGVVTNVTDFGAFVELEPGIEGLVHIGDISWARIRHPKEVFRKGQEVRILVLDVDTEKRRISLGYKQLNDPWKDIDQRYVKGADITVKVVRLADFGAFVEVEEGVEALIHISQLSTKRVEKPGDVLQEKQEVLARVIEVNPEQRRMRLSISALEEQEQPVRRSEEPRKREEHREDRQQKNVLDEVPQYNPFADAFKNQEFSDN
ncbi:S1 RNA-binding domain-containing protein [Fretibacterium sp. OH1220_COT-178]|uniref:S1 RNA-binding domain-containing protein n=1 Tax=Fretibacterium sp. OH1220_COT-178 TaxID=2491047 RepID=UPI000F5E827B|nr:S1 RNA-binding domain-containing protein [Fretibacterium sp. OH1220_COT-178]